MNPNAPAPRQAIVTRWLSPTNTRPSRVKASALAGSVIISWDHALSAEGNHAAAAKALADKFGWRGYWFAGAIRGSSGYAFVQTCRNTMAAVDQSVLADYAHFVTEGKN